MLAQATLEINFEREKKMENKIGDIIGEAPPSAKIGTVYNKEINGKFVMCRVEQRSAVKVLVISAIYRENS
jgi:hypothetical protein